MKKSNKEEHIVVYVEDSSPKMKRFKAIKSMDKFIIAFSKKYPLEEMNNSGCWLDFSITSVGKICLFDEYWNESK